jgi:hypothetical protein
MPPPACDRSGTPTRRSKGHDRKDLPLETCNQFYHPRTNAFKFRARGARGEVRLACGCVGEGLGPPWRYFGEDLCTSPMPIDVGMFSDGPIFLGALYFAVNDLAAVSLLGSPEGPPSNRRRKIASSTRSRADWPTGERKSAIVDSLIEHVVQAPLRDRGA